MAAIAMIVVSLIALSSSTYAWFTMNKTVQATGLKVTARTEGGILIKEKGKTLGSESVEITGGEQSLLPTSTADLATWVHAEAVESGSHTAKESTYMILNGAGGLTDERGNTGIGTGSVVGSDQLRNYYYIYDIFNISRDDKSKSFTNLYVSECTVKKLNNDGKDIMTLSNSLRVGVKCEYKGVTTTYIFAPLLSENVTRKYKVVTGITETAGVTTLTKKEVTAIPTADSATRPLAFAQSKLVEDEVEDLNGVDVSVYVFFEGEDTDHTTQNISQSVLDNLSVTVKFSCEAVTPN